GRRSRRSPLSPGNVPRARESEFHGGLPDDHRRAPPRSQSALRRVRRRRTARGGVMSPPALGQLVQSFFVDGLMTMKGLRPASVRSYRDALRLWLGFVAADTGRRITRLTLEDLSFERVLRFLQHLEAERHNHIRTRNQRLAALHTFFEYLASTVPELLAVAQRVAAIPVKRCPPPETCFLERDQISALFARLPTRGRHAPRDRALLLFLYNTGARVQEVSDLR